MLFGVDPMVRVRVCYSSVHHLILIFLELLYWTCSQEIDNSGSCHQTRAGLYIQTRLPENQLLVD
jgi:hypothetical protein